MARRAMTDEVALSLSGATDVVSRAKYPTIGSYDYGADLLRLLSRQLELAARPAGSWFEVGADDSSPAAVYVGAGKAVVAGEPVVYPGEVIDLAGLGNGVAYVWLADDGLGAAEVMVGASGDGWPAGGHVRLAEVTVADGAVSSAAGSILDWGGAGGFVVS